MTPYTEDDLRQTLAAAADAEPAPTDVWSGVHRRIVRRRRVRAGAGAIAIAAAVTAGVVVVPHLGGSTAQPAVATSSVTLEPGVMRYSARDLRLATDIVRRRLDALGVSGAEVTSAQGHITVRAPAASRSLVLAAAQEGVLQFRPVLGVRGAAAAADAPGILAVGGSLRRVEHVYAARDCGPGRTGLDADQARRFAYAVTCDADGTERLLGPAALDNSDVATAHPVPDSTSGRWLIAVGFDARGSHRFQTLTAAVGRKPSVESSCGPPRGCNAIAILLDDTVVAAPAVEAGPRGIAGGQTQFDAGTRKVSADALAAVLRTGPLPFSFTVASRTSPS